MDVGQENSRKGRGRAKRPLQLYFLVQQHELPQTPKGRAGLLCAAGYESFALCGHRRRASLLSKNYREILHFDPLIGDYVGTGSLLPEEDFNNILFNVFNRCYGAGRRVAEKCKEELDTTVGTPSVTPASVVFRFPSSRVEEIVDDEDGVPLLPEHGQAYLDALERLGRPRRKI